MTADESQLRRVLSLPLLVFYGVGVTVGAGIFALIGRILEIAGALAPVTFLIAGLIAGVTGWTYALLVAAFPHAAGAAIFVERGLGRLAGDLAGLGIVATGIVSSATIALAFAGYFGEFLALPPVQSGLGVVVLLALIAWWGVRESVAFAAVVTVLEAGTLAVIVFLGLPALAGPETLARLTVFPPDAAAVVAAGSVIAFFAFIGFEDIVNMAEETVNPIRVLPRAILYTLAITLVLYLLLALIAVAVPRSAEIAVSSAPMVTLFEILTGRGGQAVATIGAIAMVNGILIQIVMASRVLYGMARDGRLPAAFARVDKRRRTPVVATVATTAAILVLVASFDLHRLAEVTSLVTLAVFTLVNLSLFVLGRRMPGSRLHAWRWWGMLGAGLTAGLLAWNLGS